MHTQDPKQTYDQSAYRLRFCWFALLLSALTCSPGFAQRIADRITQGTVAVQAGDRTLAGFIIKNESQTSALIATRADAMFDAEGVENIRIIFLSGTRASKTLPAQTVAVDFVENIVILRTDGTELGIRLPKALALNEAPVAVLDQVQMSGYPVKGDPLRMPEPTVSEGRISSLRFGLLSQPDFLQIDGSFLPGNAGGPVLDAQGKVVGMIAGRVEAGVGLATPTSRIMDLGKGTIGLLTLSQTVEEANTIRYRFNGILANPFEQIKQLGVAVVDAEAYGKLLKDRPNAWPQGASLSISRGLDSANGPFFFEIEIDKATAGKRLLLQFFANGNQTKTVGPPWPLPDWKDPTPAILDRLRRADEPKLDIDKLEKSIPRSLRQPPRDLPAVGTLVRFDIHDGSLATSPIPVGDWTMRKVFSPDRVNTFQSPVWSLDGERLYWLTGDNALIEIRYPACDHPKIYRLPAPIQSFRVDPELVLLTGEYTAHVDQSGKLSEVEVADYKPNMRDPGRNRTVSDRHTNHWLELAQDNSGPLRTEVRLFASADTKQPLYTIEFPFRISQAGFDLNGNILLHSAEEGLRCWHAQTGNTDQVRLLGGPVSIHGILQHPQNNCVVLSMDNALMLLE